VLPDGLFGIQILPNSIYSPMLIPSPLGPQRLQCLALDAFGVKAWHQACSHFCNPVFSDSVVAGNSVFRITVVFLTELFTCLAIVQ